MKTIAPYNFVPFSNRVALRYQGINELPSHSQIRKDLRTGEINVTLEAETPVFISNGEKDSSRVDFFKGVNGKYMIPGSSIRGLIRENMQILGLGLVSAGEDIEDYKIYYREMASSRSSLKAGLKKYYTAALDVHTYTAGVDRNGKKITYSIPENVKAGYIRNEGGNYYIQPAARYYRVSRDKDFMKQFGTKPARTVDVYYSAKGDIITGMRPRKGASDGMKEGVLLFTGNPVGKNKNHLYVFPKPDKSAAALPIDNKDIVSYNADLEGRTNSLKAYYDVNFWSLPGEGKEKPVFYIHHNSHIYFGMSLFIRMSYTKSIAEGLPKTHRDLSAVSSVPLDYPHAIMGFTRDTKSYKSRVFCGDFEIESSSVFSGKKSTVLASPHPGFFAAYLEDGKNYEENFRLRGFKQYWMKDVSIPTVTDGKESTGCYLKPLNAGTKFKGVIRYKNLSDDELGLLLWCIKLDDGCYQTMGLGKPYGLGRMKVKIDSVKEFKPELSYSGDSLNANSVDISKNDIENLINKYAKYAAGLFKSDKKNGEKNSASIRKESNIKDFMFMKRHIFENREEVRYMRLEEYNNLDLILPSIKEFREEYERNQADAPSISKEEAFRKMMEKYGKKH